MMENSMNNFTPMTPINNGPLAPAPIGINIRMKIGKTKFVDLQVINSDPVEKVVSSLRSKAGILDNDEFVLRNQRNKKIIDQKLNVAQSGIENNDVIIAIKKSDFELAKKIQENKKKGNILFFIFCPSGGKEAFFGEPNSQFRLSADKFSEKNGNRKFLFYKNTFTIDITKTLKELNIIDNDKIMAVEI